MNDDVAEKIARSLEEIAKSLANIETELKRQNDDLIGPLNDCISGREHFHTETWNWN